MIEESRKLEAELKTVFAKLFPLAREESLPWAPCHIERFLKDRMAKEVERNTHHYNAAIVSVLAEVTPVKTHAVDMARLLVIRIAQLEQFVSSVLADCTVNIHRPDQEPRLEDWMQFLQRWQKEAQRLQKD